MANRSYRDVASMNGDGVQRKLLSAFTSLNLRRFGSVGGAFAASNQDASPKPIPLSVVLAQTSKVITASYSLQIHRVSVYASEFKSIGNGSQSSGIQVGVTIPLGRRSSVSAGAGSDGSAQLQVQKSAAQVGDWGYNGYLSAGNSPHEFGQVQYKSPVGLLTAGLDRSAGQTTGRLESQGAVSLVDRGLFPSNTIYDSFAIVDTGPVHHVHVLQENRDVGKTDSSGRLLVPDLRSFDLNRLAIKPTDIPADVTLDDATRVLRPQDRSGVVVKFPVKVSHAALLRLVDETGAPMPLGSTATLQATETAFSVGYDGDAYIENLSSHNLLTVHADRSTIAPDGLELLDAFLAQQQEYQRILLADIAEDATLTWPEMSYETITEHFRLLQACDYLSLLACVAYASPAHLLHPLPLNNGSTAEVQVQPLAPRHFRLVPWPFRAAELSLTVPARHVTGELFANSASLEAAFHLAAVEQLTVTLSA